MYFLLKIYSYLFKWLFLLTINQAKICSFACFLINDKMKDVFFGV
nr:MAG TPA: hypothetical protein [Caudoviricetes sp.]